VNPHQQKVGQYLDEAYGRERALERVLTAQIAMAPRGSSYRAALETHLVETQSHARRVRERARALGQAMAQPRPRRAWSRARSARRWLDRASGRDDPGRRGAHAGTAAP
jgi:hypothetical protein